MTRKIAFALVAAAFMGGCTLFNQDEGNGDVPSYAEIAKFQSVFMSSYFAERGGSPDTARALTPFAPRQVSSKATVPVSRLTNAAFASLAPLSLANYPEPGQTTNFTATVETSGGGTNVYRIVATTSYPSTDLRASYVEEYFLRDGDTSGVFTNPDGVWTIDDPIVNAAYNQDQIYRIKQELTFRDGTKRVEVIKSASTAGGPKFSPAAFDVAGSLDLSQAFVPAISTDPLVLYSSVVIYHVTPAANPNFWFWQGSNAQTILGVRYYTEVADPGASTYTSYTISFEKTVSTLTTTGGDFAGTVAGVYVGAQHDALAESVLRQRVVYGLGGVGPAYVPTGTGSITSNMRSRVVNISGLKDFYLTQLNSDAAEFSLADSTIYVPGADAEEIIAGNGSAFAFMRDQQTSPAAGTLPFAVDAADLVGTGALATIYSSITAGTATSSVPNAPVSNLLPGAATVVSFGGQQAVGAVLPGADSAGMGAKGGVEAWVYMDTITDTAGIVHKGVAVDFSDEAFSLQGWGNKGQVAIVLDKAAGANTSYDLLTSKINLKRQTWYHLVATWDTTLAASSYVRLYVDGNRTTKGNSATPTVGAGGYHQNSSAIVVGSQLPAVYSTAYGYFGLDGKIAGANVTATPWSDVEVQARYDASKAYTSGW